MVYEKTAISLYKRGNKCPKMLIELNKRADELVLCVSQTAFEEGVLFAYSKNQFLLMELKKQREEFSLPNSFSISDDYLFSFYSSDIYIGKKGSIKEEALVFEKFDKKFQEYKAEKLREETISGDLNYISDGVISKMFKKTSTSFFDHTKSQLNNLFSCSNRAEDLEKIIPCSKFIETISEGTKAYAGIVYKNKIPFAIGIGFSMENSDKLQSYNSYQFFYDKNNEKNGYFLSFRRASDGDRVEIN